MYLNFSTSILLFPFVCVPLHFCALECAACTTSMEVRSSAISALFAHGEQAYPRQGPYLFPKQWMTCLLLTSCSLLIPTTRPYISDPLNNKNSLGLFIGVDSNRQETELGNVIPRDDLDLIVVGVGFAERETCFPSQLQLEKAKPSKRKQACTGYGKSSTHTSPHHTHHTAHTCSCLAHSIIVVSCSSSL